MSPNHVAEGPGGAARDGTLPNATTSTETTQERKEQSSFGNPQRPDEPDCSSSSDSRRLLVAGTIVAAIAFGVLCWLFRDFTIDDVYIFLRYARNIAEGHGMRYNPGGPPSEGFSSPLWTLILAGLTAIGAPPVIAARVSSVLIGVGCLILTSAAVSHLRAGYRVTAAVLAGVSAPMVLWSVSGMGTGFTALYALAWVLLAQRTALTPRNCLLFGVFSAAGVLVRPEATLLWVALVALIIMSARDDRPRGVLMALIGAGLVWIPLELFRLFYFGHPLPAPFYAKAVEPGFEQHFRGAYYVYEFLIRYAGGPLAVIAVIHALGPKTGPKRLLRPLGLVAIAWIVWVLVVGDDWMPQFRFLVPAIPAMAGAIAVLLQRFDDSQIGGPRIRKAAVAGTVIMLVGCQFAGLWLARNDNRHYAGYGMQIGYHLGALDKLRDQALYLRNHAAPDAVVAARDIGIVGYMSGATIIDMWGLTDYEIATASPREKALTVLQRRPDYWQRPYRHALDDPRFQKWYKEVEGVPWYLYRRVE